MRDLYHKDDGMAAIAESWEISVHPDGLSSVANGEFAGQTLACVLDRNPGFVGRSRHCGPDPQSPVGDAPLRVPPSRTHMKPPIVGDDAHIVPPPAALPVLIKLIDAREPLSLQVHPNDEYARRVEGQSGKNEMWYILEAEPGAELILGFDEKYAGIGKDELRRLCGGGEILSITRRVPVKAGECYLVPAGLLHAIGKGIVIAEVQQVSNVTYRVYDYGRTDGEGRPRELHIDKALDVLDVAAVSRKADSDVLADWEHFKSRLLVIGGGASVDLKAADSFQCLVCAKGEVLLMDVLLKVGQSCFVPAGLGSYTLTAPTDEAEVLLVSM